MRIRFWAALALLCCILPARAQTQPVAMIMLAEGVVTVKHSEEDYKPARWIEPLWPGDAVRTTAAAGDRILITFFFDDHQEVVPPGTVATVGSTTMKAAEGGPVRVDKPRDMPSTELAVPPVAGGNLTTRHLAGADAPGAVEEEARSLASSVRTDVYPPAFQWSAVPGAKGYKLLISDFQGRPVFRATSKGTTYRYPFSKAPRLTKSVAYHWEVTADTGEVAVRRNPFVLLTQPLAQWLGRQQKRFHELDSRQALQRSNYAEMALFTAQLRQLDPCLAVIRKMAAMDPQNAVLQIALVRLYVARGCPAHAQAAHNVALKLGAIDPLK